MTTAWYGHLKFKHISIGLVILVSWLIALPEYALQVPANRFGSLEGMNPYQLKILQEAIALLVFVGFAWIVFKETPGPRQLAALVLVWIAVWLVRGN
jgi:uncharacterized protein (DUF486 family)